MTTINVNAIHNGYPVRGFIHVPSENPASSDVIVLFHGTIESSGSTPLTAADRFLDIALDRSGLNFESKLIYSVAYPQDAIPGWTPEAASALFPGLNLSTFYLGDNLPYAQAALSWAQSQLTNYLSTNGVTIARDKIYAFGHSQGALLTHRLNRLYTLDGVVSNAPGPIDLLARCQYSEANGDESRSCLRLKTAYGSTATSPSTYNNVSLKSFLSGTLSPALFTQALDDTTGNSAGVPQVQNMQTVVQPGIEACTTCAPATFKYYATGGHPAFTTNKQVQDDIRTFLGFSSIAQKTKSDIQNSWHDAIVELFELDLEPITEDASDKYYFTGDIFPDGTKIQWQGRIYEPFPIKITGFETTTKGTIPQPELTVANVLGTLASVTNAFDDLVGAKITRRRTLGKYLDNGTSPDLSEEFPEDIYYIERKTSETSLSISWQLASKIDLEGLQVPRRIVTQNYCVWKYRGTECGYNGPPVANERDGPLAGDDSAASVNYINALNAFNAAKTVARNAEYTLNLANGQVAANCDTNTLPTAETYSKLTGPDYSFAIVVSGQPLFGVVQGSTVDVISALRDYRPGRTILGINVPGFGLVNVPAFGSALSVANGIGPLSQIDLLQDGGIVSSFYSETFPVSFAFPEPGGTVQIGIVNGNIVPLVTSGLGYRVGPQRKSLLVGITAVDFIDKTGALCGQSEASASAAEATLAAANSQLSSAQAALSAATAALPSGGTLFEQDVCGKRLSSCKLRFGAIDLPFGAFPGANLSR